jgi:purine-nucleoside phosphorylase
MDYAPTASFSLLKNAYDTAIKRGIPVHVGNILSTDTFYHDEAGSWKLWADFGVLALEMESAALYTLAAKFKAQALSVLTVSDDLVRGKIAASEERQKTFTQMVEIALEAVL